jgi:hypothetical protein
VTCSVLVVGMPSPAGCASTKTWKAAASLVQQRLAERFGPAVAVEYAELFGPDMTRHPDVEADIAAGEAVLPIVVIDGVRRFAGGKLNVSAIERAVAEALHPGSATTPGAETASLSAQEAARHA